MSGPHHIHAHNLSELAYHLAHLTRSNPDNSYCIVLAHRKAAYDLKAMLLSLAPCLEDRTVILPDFETLAYEAIPIDTLLLSERISALIHLLKQQNPILIATKTSWISTFPPKSFMRGASFSCKLDDILSKTALQQQLLKDGYSLCHCVEKVGQIASRGAILDVFPINSTKALRIEWFDDAIESIRILDVESQRSQTSIEAISLAPVREYDLHSASEQQRLERITAYFPTEQPLQGPLKAIQDGFAFNGIEYYLPLLHDKICTLFDYLPKSSHFILSESWQTDSANLLQHYQSRFEALHGSQKQLLPPETLLLNDNALQTLLHAHSITHVTSNMLSQTTALRPCPKVQLSHQNQEGAKTLQALQKEGYRIIIVVSHPHKIHTLIAHLTSHNILATHQAHLENVLSLCASHSTQGFFVTNGNLLEGYIDPERQVCLISEQDLFGRPVEIQSIKKKAPAPITHLQTWEKGTLLVHRDYGVGAFKNIVTRRISDASYDFLLLLYKNDDKLFVPIDHLPLLSKYSGPKSNNAPLDTLGGKGWQNKRKKAKKAIEDLSAKLLEMHAMRKAHKAKKIPIDQAQYLQLCEDFPYETTPDQQRAINDVFADIQKPFAMDRLICGDVGFGKTEVALRAAFVSILQGHQVALLAPTTLLAQQHFDTFSKRFQSWPIRLHLISRSGTPSSKEHGEAIKNGQIDMVIGTHKLLQSNLHFKSLALFIIDEEHKFGVKHKEIIHHLRGQAHILSLSATPIPRTLNMAMSKLRDLSIIASPPKQRQRVHTSVHVYQDALVKESIYRELQRGGQVYYMHNDIQLLERIKDQLSSWFKDTSIGIAHGQMPKNALQSTMQQFYQNKHQILICTTIIESGIDVPNANTIIVSRADLLGLSQLHQLRGRVGRSHKLAYAVFLTPGLEALTTDARSRLESIEKQQDLGSGLNIAMQDLELRGAGDLLGASQSGHAQSIGMELYSQFLKRASLSPSHKILEASPIEIKLPITAIIPETFIPSPAERVHYYRIIDQASKAKDLNTIQNQLEDQYGWIPDPTRQLLLQQNLKLLMSKSNIQGLQIEGTFCKMTGNKTRTPSWEKAAHYCKNQGIGCSITSAQAYLIIKLPKPFSEAQESTLAHIKALLSAMTPQTTT